MDKRVWPRKASQLGALISFGVDETCRCTIKDFSQAGMLVSLDDLMLIRLRRSAAIPHAHPAVISFDLPDRKVGIEVEVVRFTDNAAGLRILKPSQAHYNDLQRANELLKPSQTGASRKLLAGQHQLSPEKRENLAKTANLHFKQFLEDRFILYFGQLETSLLVDAERQKNQAEQQPYFDAIALFRKQRQRVLGATINRIIMSALDIARGQPTQSQETPSHAEVRGNSLSLVEKDDFEDWLVVRVAISKSEMQLRDTLIELQLRIDAAFGKRDGVRVFNPYSPTSLCNTFFEVIRHLGLKNKIVDLCFKTLQDTVLCEMETVYALLNRLYIDADILPDLDVTTYLAAQSVQNRPPRPAPKSAAEPAPEPEVSLDQAFSPSTQPSTDASQPVADTEYEQAVAAPLMPDDSLHYANSPSAFGTASRLMTLQRQLSPAGPADASNARPSAPGASGRAVSNAAFQAIDQLKSQLLQGQVNLNSPGALKQQLVQAGGDTIRLSEFEHDSMDMIESLFDSIVQNERVADDLKDELRKLQVPLLKIMLKDPQLFSGEFHPARQAVNYLALLSDKGSIHLDANKDSIIQSIHDILQSEDDTEAFNQSLDGLGSLVNKEKRFIEHNLRRIRETCAGQQRLIQANRQIERELGLLLNKPVPEALLNLVNHGWKELMRLSYLREGINSPSWNMTLTVVGQLLWHMLPERNSTQRELHRKEHLLKLASKGLSKVPEDRISHQSILDGLAELLNLGVTAETPMGLYSSVELDSTALSARLEDHVETDKDLLRWIKRARNFKAAQWFEMTPDEQETQLFQLVWVSDDSSQFMFANHHATKTVALSLEQVAIMLRDGTLSLLADAAMPAVEHGLDALIQKIYDKLAFDSSHDQLTGLLTRKEFSRCLAQSVSRAQEENSQFSLIFIDILQFKVINNTCGYEAGDRFLRELARRINGVLDEDGIAGRVGPDQFALLLPMEADTQGFKLASELKASIEESRFVQDDKSFVINAVVAMLGFDHENKRVMELLRSLEAAAEIAKRSGHKDIQVVLPGDERLEELDEVMTWVTRINRALDDNNLKLRCQKITPLSDEDNALPHYEVLLTVIDGQGEQTPPAEFIKVAEEYSRMGAVDRWVIETVLRWMMAHKDQLALFGGFSINLSGHSMNDESFLDFIFDALVRYEVPRDKLIFEITETTAVANLEDAADFINEMRSIGCRFSLDDFGVGQSSYSYLKRLPVDFIKIDGAFVRDISRSDVDFALVRSITEMGHYLNKKVIAEYVTTAETLEIVEQIGVDFAQGHFYGAPGLLEDLQVLQAESSLSDGAPA
ncbi:MAG: hypothetical protein CVV07_05370 [Gammaproteobacteria bacterium HGW-Gammaproteobacteria-11]|nr:MAG: hypothetical protein CVV07_05370 [Gammaproteobacteria bacterium HGW-Gammaproteobacteria-11]